jgi:hypothetical protein
LSCSSHNLIHDWIIHCLWILTYPFWAIFSWIPISVIIRISLFQRIRLWISC